MPDGTFQYDDKCLARLPLITTQPYLGFEPNSSAQEGGLVKYETQPGTSTLSSSDYYLPIVVLTSILFTILLMLGTFIYYKLDTVKRITEKINEEIAISDGEGNIKIGKIRFNTNLVLGHGSRGTYVFKGSYEENKECAVKRVVSQCLSIEDREVRLLRDLQHTNLVRYFATERDPQFIYIAMEMAEFTLSSLIEGKRLFDACISKEEVCMQSALGLQYLHNSDIVHRDIKPQNILISYPRKSTLKRNVMIADFGLSKDISNYPTSHSTTFKTDGTRGWMAPEILEARENGQRLAPSKAADIFSLGCLFYYVIFEGKHPFGDDLTRDENIQINKTIISDSLLKQKDGDPDTRLAIMCNNLVRNMINPESERRPTIECVLKYPLFWPAKEQLQFLIEVSDTIEKDDKLIFELERDKETVISRYGWFEQLSKALQNELTNPKLKHREYKTKRLQDLLRLIRNKKNHFKDCTPELAEDLTQTPEGFLNYFSGRFPALIPYVYKVMQTLKDKPLFGHYYWTENFVLI